MARYIPRVRKALRIRDNWLGSSTKVAKSLTGLGVYSPVMYLDPSQGVCPFAGACYAVCLFGSGRGRMDNVAKARRQKTVDFISNPSQAMDEIIDNVEREKRYAEKRGYTYAPRLNGTSDLTWDRVYIATPDVQYYEYTKNVKRFKSWLRGELPRNLHLTLSHDPQTVPLGDCLDALRSGGGVAIVFNGDLPTEYHGFRVVDGDKTDARFLDRQSFDIPQGIGYVVGLRLKKTSASRNVAIDSGFAV